MSIASHLVRLQTSHSHLLINREHGAPLPSNLLERLNPAARAEFERHSQALAPQQRDAVLQCLCSNVSVITGGPGCAWDWSWIFACECELTSMQGGQNMDIGKFDQDLRRS